MKLSQYFMPTLRENPADAQVPSHRLMLRAGMLRPVASGVYTWLPFGLKVREIVAKVVREEMDASGANEIFMPMVQPASLWQETGRWDKMDAELCRIKDRHDNNFCLGPTHEEVVTDAVRKSLSSYKQLPVMLYQIQSKFRDEVRPRFGVMRGREFMMKDCYSFDVDEEAAMNSYNIMKDAYHRIFKRLGLDYRVVKADSGAIGGDLSEEFQVIAETGEDELVFDKEGDYAVNVEKHDAENCGVPAERLETKRGIEVGNIFYLGDTYSKPMKAVVKHSDGTERPAIMGCYGIGICRTVAAAIEQNHDENGIIWPEEMAPYQIGLMNLRVSDEACTEAADKLYNSFRDWGFDVLYDDRDEPAGAKFTSMDLIGLPWQCTIGPRGVKEGKAEWKNRKTDERFELPIGELPEALQAKAKAAA